MVLDTWIKYHMICAISLSCVVCLLNTHTHTHICPDLEIMGWFYYVQSTDLNQNIINLETKKSFPEIFKGIKTFIQKHKYKHYFTLVLLQHVSS